MAANLHFKIRGMDCAEEVAVLKREVGPVVGGQDRLAFDILNGKMTVAAGPSEITPDVILQAVTRTGMLAEVWQANSDRVAEQTAWQRWGRTLLTGASGVLTIAGFLSHVVLAGSFQAAVGSEGMGLIHHVPRLAQTSYGLATLAGVWLVLPKAWSAIRHLRPDMNLLMLVAVVGQWPSGNGWRVPRSRFCSLFPWPWNRGAWDMPGGPSPP